MDAVALSAFAQTIARISVLVRSSFRPRIFLTFKTARRAPSVQSPFRRHDKSEAQRARALSLPPAATEIVVGVGEVSFGGGIAGAKINYGKAMFVGGFNQTSVQQTTG